MIKITDGFSLVNDENKYIIKLESIEGVKLKEPYTILIGDVSEGINNSNFIQDSPSLIDIHDTVFQKIHEFDPIKQWMRVEEMSICEPHNAILIGIYVESVFDIVKRYHFVSCYTSEHTTYCTTIHINNNILDESEDNKMSERNEAADKCEAFIKETMGHLNIWPDTLMAVRILRGNYKEIKLK